MKTISILFLLALSACTSTGGGDLGGRVLVAPGGYGFWTCQQMANKTKDLLARQKVLERLTIKAGPGLDGQIISTMTYQPEYTANRGELSSLQQTMAQKNCPHEVTR